MPDGFIARAKKDGEVTAKDKFFGQQTEYAQWSGEAQLIAHESAAIFHGFKVMIVLKAAEHSFEHDVLKVVRTVVFRDQCFMGKHEAEVPTAPGYRFTWAYDSVSCTGDGMLARWGGAFHVKVDVEG